MKIGSPEDWDQYLEAWSSCMRDTYWFTETRFFDYRKEEVTDELRIDWETGDSVFLIAYSGDGVAGCLGVKIRGRSSIVRRWEPAVPNRFRAAGVGERLLEEAERRARDTGVDTLSTTLRYSFQMEKTWLGGLYESMGFKDVHPGIQMLAGLEARVPEPWTGYETVPCSSFSLDQLTEFTLRVFASTPEDQMIHGDNAPVSQPEAIRRAIKHQMAGGLGASPPELNMVAVVGGEPAGFIRGIVVEDGYRPRYGLLAILGVFPEHRRRSVGYSLTLELMGKFRER
ncbi:MAG TPA: GNAT family N-acetyltransferase, partial [Candidatus Desulfaltia sp.]|nr:GNAT family N-acetyltransferase [Candidatus Desulfaltia sp.]